MLNVVDLQIEMRAYYVDAVGIPKYINMLEDAQKKAEHADLLVTDTTIITIATKSVLLAQSFKEKMKE